MEGFSTIKHAAIHGAFVSGTVLIGTIDSDSKPDLTAIAWCSPCNTAPFSVMAAIYKEHQAHKNIIGGSNFTVCVMPTGTVVETNDCGRKSVARDEDGVSKLAPFDIEVREGFVHIAQASMILECEAGKWLELPTHNIFTGVVKEAYAKEGVLNPRGRVDLVKLDPLLFSFAGPTYFHVGEKVGTPWAPGAGKKK
eukprot:gnl/Dysnectes_brevis/4828_a6675_663.p1 GENE.gnl/Dysnectes_brevis/4828_a6675_663~~gnl/Dysnectes_brevis/4828_a6675_663.p1  ORF type:complete len:195 (-),score=61.46 gnl/Dysnectes_brevis/4828_a6675_663:22-606(-)